MSLPLIGRSHKPEAGEAPPGAACARTDEQPRAPQALPHLPEALEAPHFHFLEKSLAAKKNRKTCWSVFLHRTYFLL